jgi:hypothetical protein
LPPEGTGGVVNELSHSLNSQKRLSTSLIESLALALDVDPTEAPLGIGEFVDLDFIDQFVNPQTDHDTIGASFSFCYGGYTISVCSCGYITISADLEAHRAGEVPLPTSMNENTREKITSSASLGEAGGENSKLES